MSGLTQGINTLTVKNRFYARVLLPNEDGCMLWTGTNDGRGYGRFRAVPRSKVMIRAHRYSYIMHYGSIKKGGCVMHSCGNPACVAPKHLSLGTERDNNLDRHAKGRSKNLFKCGESHLNSKISLVIAKEIKSLLNEGFTGKIIAERFGVPEFVVSRIKTGRTWVNT